MSDDSQKNENLYAELRQLGKSIRSFLTTAWNSQERREWEQAIHENLEEVGDTLSQAANNFLASENGQQIQKDIDDLKTRAESGELQQQIQKDLHDALAMISAHLEEAASRFTPASTDSTNPTTENPTSEEK